MAESSSRPSLIVLGGPLAGTRLVMEDGSDDVLVGSDPSCGFCLPLPGVSPVHARLLLNGGTLTLFDAKSSHGLYLNDERVEDRIAVRNGDVIWLGSPGTDDAVMIQCRVPGATRAESPRVETAPARPVVVADEDDDEDDARAEAAVATPEAEDEAAYAEPVADDAEGEGGAAVAEVVAEEGVAMAADVHAVEADAVEADAVEAEVVVPETAVAVVEPEAAVEAQAEGEPLSDDRTRPLPIYTEDEPTAAVASSEFLIEESEEAAMAAPPAPVEPAERPAAYAAHTDDEAFIMRDPEEFRVDARETARPSKEPAGFEDDIEASATLLMPPPAAAPPPAPAAAPVEPTVIAAPAPAPRPPAPAPAPVVAKPAPPAPRPPAARSAPRPTPAPRPAATTRPGAPAGRPAKTGGGKGAVIGLAAAAAVAVLGVGGYFAYKQFAAPAPAPTPAPTPVAATVATPPPLPASTLVAEALPTPEPTPPPVEQTVTIVPSAAPTTRPSTAPTVAPTPAALRPTPAAAVPTPAAPDPAVQRAAQVASLLGQAESAAAAQNHEQAASLFEEVLKLDPGNARATAGRQAAAAAGAAARRSFVAGRTVVRTDKAGGGLAGFESSGVSVQKAPDFQGRIEFTMSPARVKAGEPYSLKTFVVNEGKKAIRISGLSVVTTVNGAPSGGPANPLAREIEPQQRALVDERSGAWPDGVNAWATEVTVTAKGDSLKNQLTWK